MNVIIVVIAILFITGIGFSVIRFFRLLPDDGLSLSIGYGYGLGVGLVAFQLYIYSRLGIVWSREMVISPWIGLFVLVFLKCRHDLMHWIVTVNNWIVRLDKVKKIYVFFLLGILLVFSYTMLEALIRPVMAWDAWAIWLLKSKIFFLDGKILVNSLSYIKSDYPLVVSLFGTFVYIFLGHIDDSAILLTSFSFYLFLSFTFFLLLKRRFGTTYALIFTFLFISTQNFIRHAGRIEAGQADLPLGYYFFVCVSLLLEYMQKNRVRVLFLLCLFLGITALVKVEGYSFTFFIAVLLLVHIYKSKFYFHLFFLGLWFLPVLDWELFKRIYSLKSNYFLAHPFAWSMQKSLHVFSGIGGELLHITSWNLLWIVYIYTFVLKKISKDRVLPLLNFLILAQFSLYIFMYLFTNGNGPESSMERLLVHLAPLVFYYLALYIHRFLVD